MTTQAADHRQARACRARRRITLGALAVSLGVVSGVWTYVGSASPPWLARAQVQRYLASHTLTRDFKVEFAFPPKQELAAAARPGAAPRAQGPGAFDARRAEYVALKKSALALERQIRSREGELKTGAAGLETLSKRLAGTGATNAFTLQSEMARLRERIMDLQKQLSTLRMELASTGGAASWRLAARAASF